MADLLEQQKARLAAMLQEGRITQAQHDEVLARLIAQAAGAPVEGLGKPGNGEVLPSAPPSQNPLTASTIPAKGKSKAWGCFLMAGLFGGLIGWIATIEESPEQKAERLAQEAEDRRKGFHCLSPWDGSHDGVVKLVQAQLRDPDSFTHVETRVTPVADGRHTLTMQYRAKNGFGGVNSAMARAVYNQADCTATLISLE